MSASIISNTRRMPDTENGLPGTAAIRSSAEKQETDDLFRSLRASLMSRLDGVGEAEDDEIRQMITELVMEESRNSYLDIEKRTALSRELFYSVRRLDILQDLIEDREVTEIMVNEPDTIYVEKNGHLFKWNHRFSSREKLEDVIQQIVSKVNRVVNESSPIVDARLPDGSRVNVVTSPVALDGPVLTIRRFPEEPITMEKLIRFGSITQEAAKFLETFVAAGYSIVIGGGTSAGKTTFLNALSNYIPKTERIITIEDNAELQIQGIGNLVRMEAKSANMEGSTEVTIRDLIRSSLRMRPDRIVVGEVRGGEAADMLQVYNTGHFVFITSVPLCENNLLFPSAILFVSSGKDEALFNYERNKTVLAANFVTALLLTSPGMPVHAEELKVEEAVTNGGFYTVVSWKKENDLLICSFSGIGKKRNLNKFLTKLLKGGQSVIICQTRQAFSTGSGYCRGCYSQWYRKTH